MLKKGHFITLDQRLLLPEFSLRENHLQSSASGVLTYISKNRSFEQLHGES